MESPQQPEHLERISTLQSELDDLCKGWPRDWFDYGVLDPLKDLDQLINECQCGGAPTPKWSDDMRVQLVCPECGAKSSKSYQQYAVVIDWNRSNVSAKPTWREFPFFGLGELSVKDALAKAELMERHLVIRAKMADIGWKAGMRMGRMYKMRLKAYAGWAHLAVLAIKREEGMLRTENRRRRSSRPMEERAALVVRKS